MDGAPGGRKRTPSRPAFSPVQPPARPGWVRESDLPAPPQKRSIVPFRLGLLALGCSLIILAMVAANARRDGSNETPGVTLRPALLPPVDRPLPAATESTPAPATAVEPEAPAPAPAVPAVADAALEAVVREALGPDTEHASVVVKRLSDGRSTAIDPDRVFYAASTFKLAVLYEALREHSAGELDFDTLLQITEADAAEDLGTIGDLETDAEGRLPIGVALHAMVTRSDNAAAVALMHHFTGKRIDESLAELGLQHTSVNTVDLPTTAGDMALLMEAIVTARGIGAAERAYGMELLEGQLTRGGIPAGLPAEVTSGNKTGTWDNATHDVAYVDAPGGMYVIVVFTDQGWAWDPIARVSAAVYAYLAR